MANSCEGTIEFLFDDEAKAKKMKSDFEGLLAKKSRDKEMNRYCDGYWFAKAYFPTICESLDCRCFEVVDILDVEKFGDRYGFTMYADDAWTSKIGLWTGIAKKYYGAEVHYSEYEPGMGVCCRWDPDDSIDDATGKYRFELYGDDWEIRENVDDAEDIKSLTDGEFDDLYKDGDSVEDFADKIEKKLGDDANVSIFEWDEYPPEDDCFMEISIGNEVSARNFDFDSVPKVDIDAFLDNGKGGK